MSVVERGASSTSARGLGPWLVRVAPRSTHGEVAIAVLPDAGVRKLNSVYRGIDKATDVLSFPSERGSGAIFGGGADRKLHPTRFLGDVVIARGIAKKQAEKLGHSLRTELRVLALHGLLHLLGYDHENDNGRMARIEARLRRKGGLPVGLIARSSEPRAARSVGAPQASGVERVLWLRD